MPINTSLVDTEGFDWDFQSDRTVGLSGSEPPGFGLVDGEIDAVDDGFILVVNGVGVNPQAASVDLGGREINTAPVLIDGMAISRSVLVSDAAISPGGFARFLDSFTNTTDAVVVIEVQTRTNSGADSALVFPSTSDGIPGLTVNDVGFTTSDGGVGGDSLAMIAYGDGQASSLAPSGTFVSGDLISVTHVLTLQPGETQSLLQFSTQNTAGNQSGGARPERLHPARGQSGGVKPAGGPVARRTVEHRQLFRFRHRAGPARIARQRRQPVDHRHPRAPDQRRKRDADGVRDPAV